MARKEIPRELSIYINDKQVVNSFRGITSEISKTNNEINNLNKNSATYNEDLARLKGELGTLKSKQAEFKNEIHGTSEAMDEGSGSFAKFRDGLLSGDFKSAKEGLMGIKGEMSNLIKTSWEFAANPIGATIIALGGIVMGTKALFDFNKELEKSNDTLRAFGVSAESMSDVRSEIKATADTFDKEFDEIAEKANSLSKSYGISMSEANDIIAKGLANGGAQNEEFLDSIGEYDEFFVKAGYSAQGFIDILNKGYDIGIYSDKLPDALKESDLSLKEQTKATRDALENAFGATFSDNLLAKVASGTITTKQALEEIAVQAKKTGLTQQQQAQLTADVFKGAGEDAGGALKILEAVGQSAQKEMSASTKAQLDLLDANVKLNKAQAELFEIKGFGGMWDAVKAQATSALADILTYVADLKNDIQPLIDFVGVVLVNAWINLKNSVVLAFHLISAQLKILSNTISTTFNFFKKIFTGDFSGAFDVLINGFKKVGDIVGNTFAKIKNTILGTLQDVVSNMAPFLKAIGMNVDAIQKKLESWKSKEVVVKTKTDNPNAPDDSEPKNTKALADELAKQKALRDAARQKEEEARQKALAKKRAEEEKAAKEELDRILALANAKANLAKAELNFFIANKRSELDASKALTPELIAAETARLDAIKDKQLTALAEERLSKVEKAQADAKSAEELAALKLTIDYDYETQRQNLEIGFQTSTEALKKQYAEEQKVLKAEQLAADNELALSEANSKFEEDKIKQDQDYQAQLTRYKKLLDDKKITEEEYNRFKIVAKKQQDEIDRQREIEQVQGTLGGLNQLAGAVTEMFGQSKELALVQAGINGAMAVTSILAQYPKFDGGFAMAAAIVAAGISTAAQIAKITKQKAPKKPKFFYGGFTGSTPHYGYDEYGPMTGMVHDEEYVIPKAMTQSPRYANTIAWLEQERTGKKTKKFADGGPTSSNVVPDAVMGENDLEMKSLLRAVLYRLENPVSPNLLIGYDDAKAIQDLNDEREASNQNSTVSE
ncbi:phage tail tape measure protein [Flavobacterium sp.]|uniref:phage tail tape measure protein n=1 Tax=Flavobacterium sp. TaxID=239 RepID=UPI002CA68DC8|nr:phage tail tape measure protein [Flavobacterium sp.]HSD07894.1 phage tail tape measure protein [Flavobacterium sp.]